MTNFDRITHEPGKMGGRACVRGLRVTVSMILGQIGAGRTNAEILADYPYLEAEDLSQALRYALWGQYRHTQTGEKCSYQPRDDRSLLRGALDG